MPSRGSEVYLWAQMMADWTHAGRAYFPTQCSNNNNPLFLGDEEKAPSREKAASVRKDSHKEKGKVPPFVRTREVEEEDAILFP